VSSGQYSDYGVRAIFTNRAAAHAYIEDVTAHEQYDPQFNDIEEWPLYSVPPERATVYRMHIMPEREVFEETARPHELYEYAGDPVIDPGWQPDRVLSVVGTDQAKVRELFDAEMAKRGWSLP
jgi:hypothetical protein